MKSFKPNQLRLPKIRGVPTEGLSRKESQRQLLEPNRISQSSLTKPSFLFISGETLNTREVSRSYSKLLKARRQLSSSNRTQQVMANQLQPDRTQPASLKAKLGKAVSSLVAAPSPLISKSCLPPSNARLPELLPSLPHSCKALSKPFNKLSPRICPESLEPVKVLKLRRSWMSVETQTGDSLDS
jgi:hypothetical protein